jgi:sugar O-acyltransferase (sialic acid O-acetyltransferase NeuD family)
MNNDHINILGIGGHAKVVFDTAKLSGKIIDKFYDDNLDTNENIFCGIEVKAPIHSNLKGLGFIAIGDNKTRFNISNRLINVGWQTIIHPTSIISNDVLIGEGSVIMAGVIIQPGTKIGRHCIINTGSVIDHDCIIGDFVHIAPKCALAGGVNIEDGSFIGIGSSIIPGISIGKWTIIGAGSVVINHILDFQKVVGVPAKFIKLK